MSGSYSANPGFAEGHISFVSTGRLVAADILAFHPKIQAKLDEIVQKGWKYLYIDIQATSEAHINLVKSNYKIRPSTLRPAKFDRGKGIPAPPPDNILELSIGQQLPKIVSIPEVQLFKVNICSKSFPRAATVDLSKDEVTYLHDPFWKWETGSEIDEKKLSDAMEVYEIASWLIDEKKFKLGTEVTEERYGELSYRFKKILGGVQ